MVLRIVRRVLPVVNRVSIRACSTSAGAPVLLYSEGFGSAEMPSEYMQEETPAFDYETNYRLKGGNVGLAPVAFPALAAGKGVGITGAAVDGHPTIPLVYVQEAPEKPVVPSFFKFDAKDQDMEQLFVPTTRFAVGHKVIAVGVNEQGEQCVSPGIITSETAEEDSFTVDSHALGPGSFIVDMETPERVCGIVLSDNSIMSAKDPLFSINWVSHVLPTLAPEGSIPTPILQYVHDVKRVVVRNAKHIPSMDLCKKIFLRNSIDDFKYYML
ncbi:hypothetical protein DIPPA_10605 [Diplonema papillatum]|nr:hypothetical protein DIPPA_10605 [Diplonema papillatum]